MAGVRAARAVRINDEPIEGDPDQYLRSPINSSPLGCSALGPIPSAMKQPSPMPPPANRGQLRSPQGRPSPPLQSPLQSPIQRPALGGGLPPPSPLGSLKSGSSPPMLSPNAGAVRPGLSPPGQHRTAPPGPLHARPPPAMLGEPMSPVTTAHRSAPPPPPPPLEPPRRGGEKPGVLPQRGVPGSLTASCSSVSSGASLMPPQRQPPPPQPPQQPQQLLSPHHRPPPAPPPRSAAIAQQQRTPPSHTGSMRPSMSDDDSDEFGDDDDGAHLDDYFSSSSTPAKPPARTYAPPKQQPPPQPPPKPPQQPQQRQLPQQQRPAGGGGGMLTGGGGAGLLTSGGRMPPPQAQPASSSSSGGGGGGAGKLGPTDSLLVNKHIAMAQAKIAPPAEEPATTASTTTTTTAQPTQAAAKGVSTGEKKAKKKSASSKADGGGGKAEGGNKGDGGASPPPPPETSSSLGPTASLMGNRRGLNSSPSPPPPPPPSQPAPERSPAAFGIGPTGSILAIRGSGRTCFASDLFDEEPDSPPAKRSTPTPPPQEKEKESALGPTESLMGNRRGAKAAEAKSPSPPPAASESATSLGPTASLMGNRRGVTASNEPPSSETTQKASSSKAKQSALGPTESLTAKPKKAEKKKAPPPAEETPYLGPTDMLLGARRGVTAVHVAEGVEAHQAKRHSVSRKGTTDSKPPPSGTRNNAALQQAPKSSLKNRASWRPSGDPRAGGGGGALIGSTRVRLHENRDGSHLWGLARNAKPTISKLAEAQGIKQKRPPRGPPSGATDGVWRKPGAASSAPATSAEVMAEVVDRMKDSLLSEGGGGSGAESSRSEDLEKIRALESQIAQLTGTVKTLATHVYSTTPAVDPSIGEMLHKVLPTDEVSALVEASPTSPTGGGGKRPPWEVDLDEDPSQEALDRLAMARKRSQAQQRLPPPRATAPVSAAPVAAAVEPQQQLSRIEQLQQIHFPDEQSAVDDPRTYGQVVEQAVFGHLGGRPAAAAAEEEDDGVEDEAVVAEEDEVEDGVEEEDGLADEGMPAFMSRQQDNSTSRFLSEEIYDDDGFEAEPSPAPAPAAPPPKPAPAAAKKSSPSVELGLQFSQTPPLKPKPPASAPAAAQRRPRSAPSVRPMKQPPRPPWELHSPPDQRGLEEWSAETDPNYVGYFSRPATSLIQMLLSTRAKRQDVRNQMESSRRLESKALTHETKEHIARLTKRGGAQSSLDDLGPLGKMDGGVRVSYVV